MDEKIEIKGLTELRAEFKSLSDRDFKIAMLKGLDALVDRTQSRLYSEMHKVFDRPTPYTLRALKTKRPSFNDLAGEVGFKEEWAIRSTKYLEPEVMGGPRRLKAFEIAIAERAFVPGITRYSKGTHFVPGPAARFDQHGNISPGQITQIMSAVKASRDPLSWRTKESRIKNKTKGFIFVTPAGIWERKGGRTQMLMFATRKKPVYRMRYPFYATASAFVRANYYEVMCEQFDKMLQRRQVGEWT